MEVLHERLQSTQLYTLLSSESLYKDEEVYTLLDGICIRKFHRVCLFIWLFFDSVVNAAVIGRSADIQAFANVANLFISLP